MFRKRVEARYQEIITFQIFLFPFPYPAAWATWIPGLIASTCPVRVINLSHEFWQLGLASVKNCTDIWLRFFSPCRSREFDKQDCHNWRALQLFCGCFCAFSFSSTGWKLWASGAHSTGMHMIKPSAKLMVVWLASKFDHFQKMLFFSCLQSQVGGQKGKQQMFSSFTLVPTYWPTHLVLH